MSEYKVVVTDGGSGNDELWKPLRDLGCEGVVADCETAQDVIEIAADADAILNGATPMSGEVFEALEKCKVVVRCGVGYDNMDIEAATERGIAISNVPDVTTDEVADHTMALILAATRRLTIADRAVRRGEWDVISRLSMPASRDMKLATIGFGNIAAAVLKRAAPFGFERLAYDSHSDEAEFDNTGVRRVTLDEALREADVLCLLVPLTDETHHLINAEQLAKMKPGAVLVNTGRGELIDTDALMDALQQRRLAFAALDVFEEEPLPPTHPLCEMENVLLTPHIGAFSDRSGEAVMREAVAEVVRALRGEPLQNQVNES